ncbi:MAG: hypothetical protein WCY29_06120, partial [Novosphingobium sp.]
MTVPVQNSRKVINGTGWSNPLTHAFMLENVTHLSVYADDVQLVLGTDYSVYGVGDPDGYSVVIAVPGSWSPVRWVLKVDYPINQPSDVDQGGQFGERFERALDRVARGMQSMKEGLDRAVARPLTEDVPPSPLAANRFVVTDEGGFAVAGPDAHAIDQVIENAQRAEVAAEQAEDAAVRAENAASGSMKKVVYDPNSIGADAFDRRNFAGEDGRAGFASKADVTGLFEPVIPPASISVDGQMYDYSVTEPAHAGKVEDKAGNFYLLRRSPAIYLEAFRDLLDLDGPGDSTAGMDAAIGMMVQEGSGRLVFPPEAEIIGTFNGRYLASNVDIDFANTLITPEDTVLPSIMFGGQLTGTTYGLEFNYQRNAQNLRVLTTITDIAAGDFVLAKDNSARLSDSTHINMEVHRVAGVSGQNIWLCAPLGWKKASFATLGGTIRKIDMKENIHLSNVRTRARDDGTTNVGIFAQMINNFSVDGHRHGNGKGDACQVRSCYNIEVLGADYT